MVEYSYKVSLFWSVSFKKRFKNTFETNYILFKMSRGPQRQRFTPKKKSGSADTSIKNIIRNKKKCDFFSYKKLTLFQLFLKNRLLRYAFLSIFIISGSKVIPKNKRMLLKWTRFYFVFTSWNMNSSIFFHKK